MSRISPYLFVLAALLPVSVGADDGGVRRIDGYRGIWFALGQRSEHGDKYSGGLGTYTSNHQPLAIYSPEAEKTFFVYGGTPAADERKLLIMVSYYDHRRNGVPRPVVVVDKSPVNDPHDNPSITIDQAGYLHIYVSGRGRVRPGTVFRSKQPWSIDGGFEETHSAEFTYPQIWGGPDDSRVLLFTKYTAGRELYWKTSDDGTGWSPDHKLAGFGGHYQTSARSGNRIGTFFNYHPGGSVDRRTNLYYAESPDSGATWTTASGTALQTPLVDVKNPALVVDLESAGDLAYTCDLAFDRDGHPVLLYVASRDFRPGPSGDPREFRTTRWNGSGWKTATVAATGHNYDMGSLIIEGDLWRVVAPTIPGPQPLGTGGEMALWESLDRGENWKMAKQLTASSPRNHAYARRPLNAREPFSIFWADGDADKLSESHLHFSDFAGKVRTLPYRMENDWADLE